MLVQILLLLIFLGLVTVMVRDLELARMVKKVAITSNRSTLIIVLLPPILENEQLKITRIAIIKVEIRAII